MDVDGGCLCGHISYRAVVDPNRVAICHCSDCQTNAATAYGVVAVVVANQFTLQSGTLKTYVKTADSGTKRALDFCPECGTRILARTVGEGTDFIGLRVGTVCQRDQLKPKIQVWCRSAQDWTQDLSQLPRFDKQPSIEDMAQLAAKAGAQN